MNKKLLGFVFVSLGLLIALNAFFPMRWLWQSRWDRIQTSYKSDLDQFFSSKNGLKLYSELGDHEFFFPDPEVFRELDGMEFPKKMKASGRVFLKIEVFRWIHEGRFGYIFQHDFFDTQSGEQEKVFEWSKSYEAGLFF